MACFLANIRFVLRIHRDKQPVEYTGQVNRKKVVDHPVPPLRPETESRQYRQVTDVYGKRLEVGLDPAGRPISLGITLFVLLFRHFLYVEQLFNNLVDQPQKFKKCLRIPADPFYAKRFWGFFNTPFFPEHLKGDIAFQFIPESSLLEITEAAKRKEF